MEKNDIMKYFDKSNGLGDYKPFAINLLKQIVEILDKFEIDYFLISGTLLGYARHNDFIPWDDDIDLVCDEKFLNHMSEIEKNNLNLNLFHIYDNFVKICFNDRCKLMSETSMKTTDKKYFYPFVDLFLYKSDDTNLYFFDKTWDKQYFFPKQIVNFNNINCSIPKSPDYFLKSNFGENYMLIYKSNCFNHKDDIEVEKVCSITKNTFDLISSGASIKFTKK